jgi:diacylglycerol kinase (ATP)
MCHSNVAGPIHFFPVAMRSYQPRVEATESEITMVRAKLICNPTAGRGRAGRQLPQAESILNSLGVETEVAFTRASGEAPDLTVKAIEEGFTLLIAVGGDGTVHEVANGIMLAKDTIGFAAGSAKLGIIPLGTGNDFLKMVGSDQDWRTACRRIAQGHSRRMDVGRVNERYFVNNVGIGFDAQVGIEAQKIRWLRGQAVYLAALARNMLLSYRTPHVSLQLDEEEVKQSITLLTIGNGRCSGGGFWLTPHA